jgi:hypothetical protein
MAKKKATSEVPKLAYTGPDRPAIEYADVVKLTSGPHGILFTIGQRYPDRNEITVIHEVVMPFDVCLALRKILDEQLELVEEHMREALKTMVGRDASAK